MLSRFPAITEDCRESCLIRTSLRNPNRNQWFGLFASQTVSRLLVNMTVTMLYPPPSAGEHGPM